MLTLKIDKLGIKEWVCVYSYYHPDCKYFKTATYRVEAPDKGLAERIVKAHLNGRYVGMEQEKIKIEEWE